MSDVIFDLEQQIINCWNIVDDIDLVASNVMDSPEYANMQPELVDKLSNILSGIARVYDQRFNQCFATFEQHTSNYHRYRRASTEFL